MKCPVCNRQHRKFPRKCETEARILGGIDHAIILYHISDHDQLLTMNCISEEWKSGIRLDKAMRQYLKDMNFSEELNTLQGWSDIIMNRKD